MKRRRNLALLFHEGDEKSLSSQIRGGKGAGLAQMVRLGVPVPQGFTVTTTAARAFFEHKRLPLRFASQFERGISALEKETGKVLGSIENPLLVSVRSGAAVSMPGMMDTVLNLGLNLNTVQGLAEKAGKKFAWDCYRRFLSMFGDVVLGVERGFFEEILFNVKSKANVGTDQELNADQIEELCFSYRTLIQEKTGQPVPNDPRVQLSMAVEAVFRSWENERAVLYRTTQNIPHWMGTAVNIQAMVFGNYGDDSGTGVVFSRNVASGEKGLYGEFLINAQGEDVVAGVRTPVPIKKMGEWNPSLFAELNALVLKLEQHYGDIVDIEFTIEASKLYLLQSRVAKRTPEAEIKFAVQQRWDRNWSRRIAMERVNPEAIEQINHPGFEVKSLASAKVFVSGLSASPGAVVGIACFCPKKTEQLASKGKSVILFREDTSPEDLGGMLASSAVVTATGGATSHAAVVMRGSGKPAVVGCSKLHFNGNIVVGESGWVQEGDTVSVNGQTGMVYAEEILFSNSIKSKEVQIFSRWISEAKPKKVLPRVGFEWFEKDSSENTLLNDFYLSDAMARASKRTPLAQKVERLRANVHTQVAEILACYLLVSVAGELRHAWEKTNSREISEELRILSQQFSLNSGGDRCNVQTTVVSCLQKSSSKDLIKFLELATKVFDIPNWDSSFGGKAWGHIAKTLMLFLNGELSHSVFVDHAFDLEHNNGSVFGKHRMLCGNRDNIKQQLEVKKYATSVAELYSQLSNIHNTFTPEVMDIFQKGAIAGIWKLVKK